MKNFLLSSLIIISLTSISSNNLFAWGLGDGFGSGSSIGGEITIPDGAGMFDPLIQIYNKLIVLVKKAVESNMKQVVKSANILLSTMATSYIIVMGTRSFLTGSQFLSSSMEKMFGFLCLLALLQFDYYDKYILANLEVLFNGLPTLFGSGGGDIITNIIIETSSLVGKIWKTASSLPLWAMGMGYVMSFISMTALASLTLVVLINVLILTVEFYFVLSISSILILLFFFKFTRSLSMGAVQIVFGAILKVTLLSLFLSMFGGIIREALVFDGEGEFFASCMGVVLISTVGIILIKVVNEIANRITGGVGQMAGANVPHLGNLAKNLIGK